MDTQQKIILIVLACVLLALVVTLGCVVVAQNRPVYGEFQVPAWEEHAVQGTPPEPLPPDYGSMAVNEDYVFSMRAAPVLTGQDLTLYFTSPATNTVWLRVKICDTDGTVLYESGLLRPGEYLPSVTLSALPSGETVQAVVYSYETQTYYSMGTASASLQYQRAE